MLLLYETRMVFIESPDDCRFIQSPDDCRFIQSLDDCRLFIQSPDDCRFLVPTFQLKIITTALIIC